MMARGRGPCREEGRKGGRMCAVRAHRICAILLFVAVVADVVRKI